MARQAHNRHAFQQISLYKHGPAQVGWRRPNHTGNIPRDRYPMSKALLKSTGVVGAMTFVSRILGFVRDMVFAQLFGAGAGTDAFFVAFKIPNFMRRLFAEGAFSQAFVPVFSEYRTQRSRAELKGLVDDVAGTLGGILFLITAVGVLAAR